MEKERKVIESYLLMNKLKDIIRTGWKTWNVTRKRVESIAEHVYGVQQLAIIIYYTYKEKYEDLDILKVITMLAIHETEEVFIGDLTLFEITKEEKQKIGHKKIHEYFSRFIDGEELEKIILEFDEGKTKEAKFAYQCDKLEADIQAAIYDSEGCIDLNNQKDNKVYYDEKVQKLFKEGMSFGEAWLSFGQALYNYDENFLNISNYIKENIDNLKEDN